SPSPADPVTAPAPPLPAPEDRVRAAPVPTSPAPAPEAPTPSGAVGLDALEAAWDARVLPALSNKARARFRPGRFLDADDTGARFALPNAIHRDRCAELRDEVEAALAAALGHPVRLELVVDEAGAPAPRDDARRPPVPTPPDDDDTDLHDLVDADGPGPSAIDRVIEIFPGAEPVDD
ncbi:MAG TPA: hypothetical protein VK866_18625, partial [Acidimicrobiales bacterium]|nr:hypothetical protein [Acidimicrobiales bacterium]